MINVVAINPDGTAYSGAYTSYRDPDHPAYHPSDSNHPRSIVQFNVYHSGGTLVDAVGGTYDKKILIFPDKISIDYGVNENNFKLTKIDESTPIPTLNYVTVHASRLFGVDDNRIYASAYNDYTDWDVDTATDVSPDNAWVSTTGSNTRADSDFTAICEFDGKVIAFKRDFMYQVGNQQNPFRMKDIAPVGAIDFRSVAEINRTLYFVSQDEVYAYAGGQVRKIGAPLGKPKFKDGVSGAFRDTYYLYDGHVIYTYDTVHHMWGVMAPPSSEYDVVNFCADENALYCLVSQGTNAHYLYKLENPPTGWYFETDLSAFSTFDVKRINKLSLLCEIPAGGQVKAFLIKDGAETGLKVLDSTAKNRTGSVMLRGLVRAGASHGHRLLVQCYGDVEIRGLEVLAIKEADSYE